MNEYRIKGFEPVYREDARILICGSMPSVVSLQNRFYYGHPRNVFWKMIAEILREEIPNDIQQKKELLIRNGIALWDSVESCHREGSLDTAIRSVVPNDFDRLYALCPGIHSVLFNGGTAMDLYRRYYKRSEPERTYYRLPSTSPAYTLKYDIKKQEWENVLKEVLRK